MAGSPCVPDGVSLRMFADRSSMRGWGPAFARDQQNRASGEVLYPDKIPGAYA
jgi:hypothetical protein